MHLVFISNTQIIEEQRFIILTVTPLMSTILDTTSPHTDVATMSAIWSDGSMFTGTFIFVAPNFDNSGHYEIVGDKIRVSSLGVGDQGGLDDLVTVEAVQ